MQRLLLIKNQLSHTYSKLNIEYSEDKAIGIINLNAPKELNALTKAMRCDIYEALRTLDRDPKVKVVILRSLVEKAFCAGANIKEFGELTTETQCKEDVFSGLDEAFGRCSKPVIALVNGVAAGGGFEIALSSDIILVSEDVKIMLPEINLGTLPGIGGTQRAAKLIGKHNAMKFILLGEPINAQEAFRLGICQGVYKKENLHEEGLNLAKKISEKAFTSVILATKAIRAAEDLGISDGIKYERSLFNLSLTSKALKEGSTAFVEKRKANFKDL